MDVPRACVVFPAKGSCTELTNRHKKIDIITTNKVLGQIDYSLLKRYLPMMVVGFLRYISNKLSNLDLLLQVFKKAAVEDLPLAGLQAIHYRADASLIIINREANQVSVNKILESHLFDGIVYLIIGVICVKPDLSFISQFPIKEKFNLLQILLILILKVDLMAFELPEIIPSLFVGGCSETFVVFDPPGLAVGNPRYPRAI